MGSRECIAMEQYQRPAFVLGPGKIGQTVVDRIPVFAEVAGKSQRRCELREEAGFAPRMGQVNLAYLQTEGLRRCRDLGRIDMRTINAGTLDVGQQRSTRIPQ